MNLNNYLSIAKTAATSAGKFLLDYKRNELQIIEERGKDIKISADKEAEKIILEILKRSSAFPVLSEESGLSGDKKEGGPRWIVDPLDGTLNFFRQIPYSSVSVGLWDNEKPLLGAVYDFNQNELFESAIGKGALLNGKRISVSKIKNPKEAVLVTGFPVKTDFSPRALENYAKQVAMFKKVRLLGSAALSLVYVASGRADAYFEKDIMLWDIAGGLAVLLGAGGKFKITKTKKKYSYNLSATNSMLKTL